MGSGEEGQLSVALKTLAEGTSASKGTRGVLDTQGSLCQTQGNVDTDQRGNLANCCRRMGQSDC